MKAPNSAWLVLGFTPDDVVGAEQDSRLAFECSRAWEAEGAPPEFAILRAPGDGDHMVRWFLNEAAVCLLDGHEIGWRQFLIAERSAPPATAQSVIISRSESPKKTR